MNSNILEFIKKHKVVIVSILITLFIEIFICNYGFFRTLFYGNNNLIKDYTCEGGEIVIQNINCRVTNIYFEYYNPQNNMITYNVSYIAEESSNEVSINEKVMLANNKHYINFDTHSNCQSIKIIISCETETALLMKNIILNHPTININIVRMILIFFVIIFAMQLKNKKIYNKDYDSHSKYQDMIFIDILIVLCALIFLYVIFQYNPEKFLIDKNDIKGEDSLLMQTESIMNGKIELMEEPSDELKNMENPYDNVARKEQEIEYLYDVAYYNGKYYNYFGIAPILTSILPFRIITGMYTHTYMYNMFYIFIAIFSLYFLYKKLVNKFVKKISLCNYYLGFYAILFGSNIFTLLRGEKYDIVISSGIAFLLISLNLAMSIYSNLKYKNIKLILLGLTTGLVVLSKPNLIVYYLLILFFTLVSMKELKKSEKIKDIIIICIPLGILAVFQMIWNYLRFDNILEFGAKYQLTDFNMIYCMSITFGKIYAGIMEYLFKTPSINPLRFPFVFINKDINLISINEICYENRLVGLIAIPIMYSYLLKKNIMKNDKNKESNIFINICLITSILSIIISTCFGGICEVYSVDFKLILSIGAIIILLKWLDNNRENEDLNKIFLILCVATMLIMIPI
jgi:hypothetical protein